MRRLAPRVARYPRLTVKKRAFETGRRQSGPDQSGAVAKLATAELLILSQGGHVCKFGQRPERASIPPVRRCAGRRQARLHGFMDDAGNARLFDTDQALAAGIIHEAVQARLPEAGETSHWWNG